MHDIRFALRMSARNPGSTALIVVLLAVGIGACTTMFSLYDAILLRPLPVSHPEQLVELDQHLPHLPVKSDFPFAYYEALRDHAMTLIPFAGTGEYMRFRMTVPEPAEEITVHAVTPNFFQVLGVHALLGRVLMPDDDTRASGTPPAVLSYNFWRRRFRGDPSVIRGQTLEINGHRVAIVGVMPRDFNGLSVDTEPDIRVPVRAFSLFGDYKLEWAFFEIAGRLKPGVTRAEAQAECLSLWQSTMRDYYRNIDKIPPEEIDPLIKRGISLDPFERGTSILRDSLGNVLKLLMASIGVLVLIVALNVAGLLLARMAARQQEMAVRLAIGGTPWRLARQMVTESVLLAAFGAAGGLLITPAATPVALDLMPPVRDLYTNLVQLSVDTRLDGRAFVFLLALSLLTTLIFTASPTLLTLRLSIDSVLRRVRASSGLRGRQFLIVLQMALCTFLLVSAGLLVRSFEQLRDTPSGFARDSIATFTCDLEGSKEPAAIASDLMTRIREVPGVVSVASSSMGVMLEHGTFTSVAPEGQRIGKAEFMDSAINSVSAGYFATMGMQTLSGRDFLPSDVPKPKQTAPVNVVVNEPFVRRFFPGVNPLGKRFGGAVEGNTTRGQYEIVGIVSAAKYRSLAEPIRPMFFVPQSSFDSFVLNVGTRIPPEQIIEPVRRATAAVAPGLPFLEVNTLAHEIDETTAPERISALLASLFGGLATLLAGIGIYGLLAYAVTQRRREIGIRMALGAQRSHVGRLIARQTFVMAAIGITAGLAAALITGPAIRSLLYGVQANDPASFLAAAVFVGVIAAAATALPVAEATQVQPAETLRLEN